MDAARDLDEARETETALRAARAAKAAAAKAAAVPTATDIAKNKKAHLHNEIELFQYIQDKCPPPDARTAKQYVDRSRHITRKARRIYEEALSYAHTAISPDEVESAREELSLARHTLHTARALGSKAYQVAKALKTP